jgi:hypothetical protein
MEESLTHWLREQMRDLIANHDAPQLGENVLSFRRPPNSAKPGEDALGLVYQAAERIREADDYAAEREARVETLAKQAIEKLKIAHDRIRAAESGRRAAETEIKKLGDRVREAEKVMEESVSRISAIEAQLSAAEQRATTAEMRATEAENALKCIEEALRTRILDFFGNSSRLATAA